MKINLGCGKKIIDGFINIDYLPGDGIDKIINLDSYPWDFNNDSIEEIYADNIIEHLDFYESTKEIHRILIKGGLVTIKVPYFSNPGAFFADHKCFFNFYSYSKYCINDSDFMDISEPYFELLEKKITFLDDYKKGLIYKIYYLLPKLVYKINPNLYIWLFSYIFPASEVHFYLKKI